MTILHPPSPAAATRRAATPCLPQPARTDPFLPRPWVHRYHRLQVTRSSDGATVTVPCSAANFFLMDLNPRWYVDQLALTGGNALFILYLDTTNSCTDRCGMCFTEDTRRREGFSQRLDTPLALRRIAELRDRYPETFKMVSLAGPGEPLNLPSIAELLEGTAALGLACRVYTAGKQLRSARVRSALLASTSLVRVSIDAATETSFEAVHQVQGLAERLRGISALIAERDAAGSEGPLVGLHFVIQDANQHEIVPFARMARDLSADFVVYGQETFGHVAGGFTDAGYQQVLDDLETVEAMHNDTFAVVVPRLVQRQTYLRFDKGYFASPAVLNRCHNSRHRIFFGVQNDFSACWLAALDSDFRDQAHIGRLDDDRTMDAIGQIIDGGVGAVLDQGARLSCNSCVASNYNGMVDAILDHLDGETAWETTMVTHQPGATYESPSDERYRFVLAGSTNEILLGTEIPVGPPARRQAPTANG